VDCGEIANEHLDRRLTVRKTPTEEATTKPATPKIELPPSTQLRKVVLGGYPKAAGKKQTQT
jgi:hypothetical protein